MVSWWVRTSSTIGPPWRLIPKPTPALSTLVVAMYDTSLMHKLISAQIVPTREKKDLCLQFVLSAASWGVPSYQRVRCEEQLGPADAGKKSTTAGVTCASFGISSIYIHHISILNRAGRFRGGIMADAATKPTLWGRGKG